MFRGVRFFLSEVGGWNVNHTDQEDSTIALPAFVAVYILTWQDDIRWPSKPIIPEIRLEEEKETISTRTML